MDILGAAILEILQLTVDALEHDDNATARRIEPLEEVIDDMVLLLKKRHTDRLCQGICSIQSGIVFMDALTHLQRRARLISLVAMTMLGRNNEAIMRTHHELHASGDQSYLAEQAARRKEYLAPLQQIKY